jgi:hypothetical protein
LHHSFRLTTAGEISDENQKKVTDLENEVRGLKVTVEKKEHAIKALREEKDDCLNRYVYLYFTQANILLTSIDIIQNILIFLFVNWYTQNLTIT